MGNGQAVEQIRDILTGLKLSAIVEIIANVLIQESAARMDISDLTPENILEVIIADKVRNGESLQNAVLHQGLLMLMWLK